VTLYAKMSGKQNKPAARRAERPDERKYAAIGELRRSHPVMMYYLSVTESECPAKITEVP
jgi:hypothetical protein